MSLLVVDVAKRLRAQGIDKVMAFVQAGRLRVRPILLTTITTFLGVSPLIFFASGQTAFLAPMAVSLGFGLLFATGLILVALPCFYLILDDLRELVYQRVASRWHCTVPIQAPITTEIKDQTIKLVKSRTANLPEENERLTAEVVQHK